MVYTALYRKFRPRKFEEMVGQEHITKTIKNQIMAGRVGHAYLFNGGRGTGKTSAAKILARAVNCLNIQEGEPCNECEMCKGALNGTLTDIVEMDAASNNSVEDIRNIREEVNFLPSIAKYRVYIIDEVHMLSTGAFNALLKTLEEPPSHVKFILATTEPQKLPATILSRCQRFDFKKISTTDIIKRLEIICKETGIETNKEALNLIATLSEGAMRDAISILERCVQDGEAKLEEEKIKELVGIPKFESIHNLVESISQKDIKQTIEISQSIINEGKEVNNILWEIIRYLKDVLIYKTTKQLEIYSEIELKNIENISGKLSIEKLVEFITKLSELDNKIKHSTQRQLVFQTGIISLCKQDNTQEYIKIEERIKKLENGIVISNPEVKTPKPLEVKKEDKPSKKETKPAEITSSAEGYLENWGNIVNKLKEKGKVMLYTNLLNTRAKKVNDTIIGVEFINGITAFGKTVVESPENKRDLEAIISNEYGAPMNIKILEKKVEPVSNSANIELEIPINIIDE